MLPPPLSSAPFPLHTRFVPPSTTTRTQPTGMQGLPGTNAQYSSVRFWDDRYGADGPPRDWFGGLSSFSGLLEEQLRKEDRLLVLGCGDSSLSHDLYQRGYTSITNIDYSPVCIEAMRKRHAECHGMVWTVMDARALTFSDESFDVVLEKGTLDAMMVEERDPWDVSAGTSELLDQVLKEVSRVLRPGGRFISITFAQPHFRKRHYAQPGYSWSISCSTYGSDFHFFFYVMRKGEDLSAEDQELGRKLWQPSIASPQNIMLEADDNADFLSVIEF
ncbi:EEF1A lysine methyltransferase 4 [Ambystoma mexicanum]|uniref:EEF1A lysine methyltransferase 4 n=1 Tax=Ambystoma mexicanum TaxID=8296 RepID=UPI0037E74FD5